MRIYQKLRARLVGWRLGRDIKAGRVLRGRLPDNTPGGGDGTVRAKSEPLASIRVRVFRAGTQQWEDVN